MKRLNGNLLKGILIAAFTVGLSSFVAKEIWTVRTLYEIKTDVAIIKDEGLDNIQEHTNIRIMINDNKKSIASNKNEINLLRATIKQ